METDFKIIQSLEIELTKEGTWKNKLRLSELLSDSFEEVGKTGKCYNKSDILNMIPSQEYQSIDLSNFKYVQLSVDTVLIKYISVGNSIRVKRSSIWVKSSGKWQILYHQGTTSN